MARRKSGFVRFRRRRRRKTFGDKGGKPVTIFKVVVVAQFDDLRERMRVAQRAAGLNDDGLAARIGLSKQAFCQLWRRRSVGEQILSEIEAALGVGREYWTAPLELPERVPPVVRLAELADQVGRSA